MDEFSCNIITFYLENIYNDFKAHEDIEYTAQIILSLVEVPWSWLLSSLDTNTADFENFLDFSN